MGPFEAYDKLRHRTWQDREPVDVYLSELRRLAGLGGIDDTNLLKCAFVVGLPSHVAGQLKASARLQSKDLSQLVATARGLVTDCTTGQVCAAGRFTPGNTGLHGDSVQRGVTAGDGRRYQQNQQRRQV